MRINTNITAIISNNSLQKAENRLSKSIERLSSGYKLNSSLDDPAGYAISEKMRVQIRGLDQADNNTVDGISVLNTAEGGMIEIQAMLTRMKELSVQAANDVNSDGERSAIQAEIDNINKEIDRIAQDTEFNTQPLINGNLCRRVYSSCQGVNQIECSDGFVAGNYGINITQDARQAVAIGDGTITMGAGQTITDSQAGVIEVNGYQINIQEGDSLNDVVSKIIDGVELTGGRAFVIAPGAANDTQANGTQYAGYEPATSYTGSQLVMMTKQYGKDQEMIVTCDNPQLAALLGISSAASKDGLYAAGCDAQAEFMTDLATGKRMGFADSAVISSKGTKITVKDVNNKTFTFDIPGNVAGTKFNDIVKGQSVMTGGSAKEIIQEVTDVGTMSIHVGANEYQTILLDIPAVTTYALGTQNINVMTGKTAGKSIEIVDEAVSYANAVRSKIGAYQNRFDHTRENLATSTENITSAMSSTTDTDMAEEMTEYTSINVLAQAATSILAQANERPSTVLQLLQ